MKTTINAPFPRTPLANVALLCVSLVLIGSARGGTINIDFQSTHTFSRLMNEPGLMGTGSHWNAAFDSASQVLNRDDGTELPTAFLIVGASTGGVNGDVSAPNSTRNKVQRDGINATSARIGVTISNLRVGIPLKVILYFGDFGEAMTATVGADGGVTKTARNPTSPSNLREAVEGRDYLVFENVYPADAGTFAFIIANESDPDMGATHIAGVQIQGWLPGEPFPSKTDLLISKKRKGGYEGNNVYRGNQLQKISGKRKGTFYHRLQNDGDVWANYRLRSKGTDSNAVRRWFDLSKGRRNITAQVAGGAYTAALDPGERKLIQGILRARPGSRRAVSVLRGFALDDRSVLYSDKTKAIVVP